MSYKDSIVVERLRKKFGDRFCYMVEPWHLYGWERSVGTTETPQSIFPNAQDSFVNWLDEGRSLNEATILKVVSDSATDVEGSTGASKIKLIGINEKFQLDSEEVKLNGTTAVDTANKWRDINSLEVIEGGRPGHVQNAGNIHVKDNSGTFVIASIRQGHSKSEMGKYTVPPGKELYLTSFRIVFEGTTAVIGDWILYSSMPVETPKGTDTKYCVTRRLSGGLGSTADTNSEYKFIEPLKFETLSQLNFVIQSVSAEAKVSVFAEGFELITDPLEIDRRYKNDYTYKPMKSKKKNYKANFKNPHLLHVNTGKRFKQVE